MPNVAAVRLTYNPRVLWFDPNGVEFSAGDALIVKTERGLEYGVADENLKEVSEDAIAKLKSPLKPVMRKATSEDSAKWANLQAQAEEALPVFKNHGIGKTREDGNHEKRDRDRGIHHALSQHG